MQKFGEETKLNIAEKLKAKFAFFGNPTKNIYLCNTNSFMN